jgi:hypothetical protein
MARKQAAPRFSQSAVDAFRHTRGFEAWNRDFEALRQAICRRVSPRDVQTLQKAGAKEDNLITLLALVVSGHDGLPSTFNSMRRSLAQLADQLTNVIGFATRIVNDPLFDGRFWLALEGELSWDLVPKAGVIEASVLQKMQAFAQLIRDRGKAFGELSRPLKRVARNRSMWDLIAYVCASTKGTFDAEISYLLGAAYRAGNREKHFTADQIKKFRQRHFTPDQIRKLKSQAIVAPASGLTTPGDRERSPRKSLGQSSRKSLR